MWADKVVANALKTYSMADGSTVSVTHYTAGRFGLVVSNAAGKVYQGYQGLRLRDVCRMAAKFGYQDFDRGELDNAAQIEVAEEAQAEAPADPAPAEGEIPFVPGDFAGGGGHDDDL